VTVRDQSKQSLNNSIAVTFKENLLKKIRIKALAKKVLASMGTYDSGKRTDIDALRELLDMSPYTSCNERDLVLYVRKQDAADTPSIIVLGNDLPLYASTVADVVLRRSPTVKEMISIRNAIKILKDSDIMVSKGAETLETIQQECIEMLDLTFDEQDLMAIAGDGAASLESGYQDGVLESLSLFGELLDFQPPPKRLAMPHFHILGSSGGVAFESERFGPMVLYGKVRNELKLIDVPILLADKANVEWFHQIVKGATPAAAEGAAVFQHLIRFVLDRTGAGDA